MIAFNQKSKGFTLVEIAIVLVIIGLLIGGVLKGQEMINNAKIKRVGLDFDSISTALHSYQDLYRTLAGDDNAAQSRWGASVSNGDADGILSGKWTDKNDNKETRIIWQHLRYAKLITGDKTSFEQPVNPYSGIIGIENDNFGLTGLVICMSNVDGANALIIDTQLDDGNPDTGSLRGSTKKNQNSGDSDYSSTNKTYNLCRKF